MEAKRMYYVQVNSYQLIQKQLHLIYQLFKIRQMSSISSITSITGKIFMVNSQKYQQIDSIGEGGQAEVHKVVHLNTKKQYAIKIAKRSRYESVNRMIDQQISIMKNLSTLNCPSIIKLIDVEINEQNSILVLELGEYSLANYKDIYQTTLTVDQTLTLIKDILLALKTVHKVNIIHRDIKPQNIIVNTMASKHPYKLTDFGVSADKGARKCTFIGTLPYMAPEVLQSRDQDNYYTETADIWSFALVVFQAYFGFNPFAMGKNSRGDEQIKLIEEISSEGMNFAKLLEVLEETKQYHLSADLRKNYALAPPQLIQFLTKGLHENPKKRITLYEIQKLMEEVSSNESGNKSGSPEILLPSISPIKTTTDTVKNGVQVPNFVSTPPQQTIAKTAKITSTQIQMDKKFVESQQYNYDVDMQSNKNIYTANYKPPSYGTSQMSINQKSTQKGSNQTKTIMTPVFPKNIAPESTMSHSSGSKTVRDMDNQKLKFVKKIEKKLLQLRAIIKPLPSVQFSEMVDQVIEYINSKRYDTFECKLIVQKVYHKLFKLFDKQPMLLQDQGMSPEFVNQFLYELIILSSIAQILKNPGNATKGLPLSISNLAYDATQYFDYSCNSEMLKEFEWRFFSKGNLVS